MLLVDQAFCLDGFIDICSNPGFIFMVRRGRLLSITEDILLENRLNHLEHLEQLYVVERDPVDLG